MYGQLTAPKPDKNAITVTPITPILLTHCSMERIPCLGLRIGNGSPIFQKSIMIANQKTQLTIKATRFERTYTNNKFKFF